LGGVVSLPDHTTHAVVLYIKSHACPFKQDDKEEILMWVLEAIGNPPKFQTQTMWICTEGLSMWVLPAIASHTNQTVWIGVS
jgi:hypothetical protein